MTRLELLELIKMYEESAQEFTMLLERKIYDFKVIIVPRGLTPNTGLQVVNTEVNWEKGLYVTKIRKNSRASKAKELKVTQDLNLFWYFWVILQSLYLIVL